MRIDLTSIPVDDQQKALKFYTDILGFVKKQDFPVGKYRYITVVSPERKDGTELSLEPNENPITSKFQEDLVGQGIPLTSFGTDDINDEFQRMKSLGVTFTMEPTNMGPVSVAVFDDTCGNLIQIHQKNQE